MQKNARETAKYNTKLELFLEKFAVLRVIMVLAFLVISFNLFLFPLFMPSGEGLVPLDLMFGYDPDNAFRMIEAYGEEGRRSYFLGLLLIDFIYPVVYSLFLALILYLIYKKPLVSMIPLSILAADFAENTGILIMLSIYPERIRSLAAFTGTVTAIKWILAGITVIVILPGLPGRLKRRK